MKLSKVVLGHLVFLIVPLLQPSALVVAQDVAAAARTNRAARATSAKTDGAWYNPTRVTLHAQDQDNAATVIYEISSNQDLRITMDTREKEKRETGIIMLINGQRQWRETGDRRDVFCYFVGVWRDWHVS